MIYPDFPKANDTIGICAPSAGVGCKLESFDLSLEALKNAGFKTAETASVRSENCPAADSKIRGAEFNSMFDDDNISMVLCASGGDYCIEMLPYINQDTIALHPKWFAGYSDPTSIEMLLTTKLDIATIYGVNAGAWDWQPLHDFQLNALSVIKGDIPMQRSYEHYSASGYNDDTGLYEMDGDVKWKLYLPSSRPGRLILSGDLDVSGRLIGGCIDVIDCLIGTPYEDLEGFARRYADDGLIWFFDNFALDPLQLQYAMRKMQLKGLFEHARAVVFGRTFLPGSAGDDDYLSQLERVFIDTEVPLIWNADIGHTKPSFTIINGAIGHLTYREGAATLSMTFPDT